MGDPSSQRSITVSTLSIKVGPGRRAEAPGPTGEGLARTCTHLMGGKEPGTVGGQSRSTVVLSILLT